MITYVTDVVMYDPKTGRFLKQQSVKASSKTSGSGIKAANKKSPDIRSFFGSTNAEDKAKDVTATRRSPRKAKVQADIQEEKKQASPEVTQSVRRPRRKAKVQGDIQEEQKQASREVTKSVRAGKRKPGKKPLESSVALKRAKQGKIGRPRRSVAVRNYEENNNEHESDDNGDNGDDDDSVAPSEVQSEIDDSESNDERTFVDSDSDSDFEKPEKKPTKRPPIKSTKDKIQTKTRATTVTPSKSEADTDLKKTDNFSACNAPIYSKLSLQQIAETKEFLDPCGLEATDDIIDGLIGNQVDKIGSLLLRSLGKSPYVGDDDENLESVHGMGSTDNLLKLGTACSGTDAPALALTLIQEQMELRGLTKENGKRMEFEHGFSCEVDPFKQGMNT